MDQRQNIATPRQGTKTGLEDFKIAVMHPQTPLPGDKLREHIIATYHRLRLGMGLTALLFPILVPGVGFYYGVELQNSYSAYYFGLPAADLTARSFPGIFPTRVVFCGLLFALGCFLILYRGFNKTENWLLNFAGWAAIGVALFPMWPDPCGTDCELYPKEFPHEPTFRWYSKFHYASAIFLFACMALVSWVCAKTTLDDPDLEPPPLAEATWSDRHPFQALALLSLAPPLAIPVMWWRGKLPAQKETFRLFYNGIGVWMLLFPVIATVLQWVLDWQKQWILLAEAYGVWAFASFWLIKSRELSLSQPEQKAFAGSGTGLPDSVPEGAGLTRE